MEIFSYFIQSQKNLDIFIGIQHNSIPETEDILKSFNKNVKIKRVSKEICIDSDASGFITALELYKDSEKDYEKCYFVHTKGITSGNDSLRKLMFNSLFSTQYYDLIQKNLEPENVGSYSLYLTTIDVPGDIKKLSCLLQFNKDFTHNVPIEYYYINTFFVIKNHILKRFIENVDDKWFETNIGEYSDRWLFERDFCHIVDMYGYLPSFRFLHGNYSTGYKTPTINDFDEKVKKWNEFSKGPSLLIE